MSLPWAAGTPDDSALVDSHLETGEWMADSVGCEWCGRRPLTREHLIPRWLRDLLHARWGDEFGLDISIEVSNEHGVTGGRSHAAPLPEMVVKAVCTNCNSGWMAELESAVRPVLSRMVTGESVHLDERAQADLARWAAKTAILVGHYLPGLTVLDGAERRDLASLGQAPLGFHIRLAHLDAIEGMPLNLLASNHVARRPGDPVSVDEPNSFSVTLAIGHLVVAVIGGPGMRNYERWAEGGALPLMIWPPTIGGISWPPTGSRLAGQDAVRGFHESFWVRITNPEFPRPDARRRIPPK